MIKLIEKPWEWLCWLWGLVFPMSSPLAAANEKASPAARWVLRVVVVGIFLGLLGLINQSTFIGLTNWIKVGSPLIQKLWLPIFGLCLYVLIWLGWWLYRILSLEVDAEASEFPDIDRAWAQAMDALSRADIRLDATPLFLVLGWSSGSEEALFDAAGIKAKVKQVPRDKLEPLHVTADRDSIWLTCPGVSLLGQRDPSLVGQGGGQSPLATMAAEENVDAHRTLAFEGLQGTRPEDLAAWARSQSESERAPVRASPVVDRDKYLARLRHLCRLIKRDRLGFCPINGLLILLPVSAGDPASRPEDIAAACRSDLTEAFGVFRMRCPILVMVTDLERIDGFADLVSRLPAGQTGNRMGQRFPLVPDLSDGELPAKVESSVDWVVNSLFGTMVYSMFHVESNRGVDEVSEVLRGNQSLFRFLVRIRERRERLARLVRDCIPNLPGEKLMFGGCYFAATGDGEDAERAFASGVLIRLVQDQDLVSWTQEAMAEDAAILRTARALKLGLSLVIGMLIVAILGLIGLKVWGGGAAAPKETA